MSICLHGRTLFIPPLSQALYGYEPPAKARDALRDEEKQTGFFSWCCGPRKSKGAKKGKKGDEDSVSGHELTDMQGGSSDFISCCIGLLRRRKVHVPLRG